MWPRFVENDYRSRSHSFRCWKRSFQFAERATFPFLSTSLIPKKSNMIAYASTKRRLASWVLWNSCWWYKRIIRLLIKHCLTKYTKQSARPVYDPKDEEVFNFSLYLNLILSEFMGIEIEALLPEREKPGRTDRSYFIIFMCKEDCIFQNCFSNSTELQSTMIPPS